MSVNFTLRNMPRDPEKNKPSIFSASVLFFIGVAGLYVLPAVMTSIELAFGAFLIPELTGLIEAMYYIVFIVLPIVLYVKSAPSVCADTMRINPLSLKSALLCVAGALITVYLTQILTLFWTVLIESAFKTPPASNFVIPTTAAALASSIFSVAVIPGICEELLFRGAILGAWEERGSKRAIVISSIWFMLMHGSLVGMPAQFLSGIILGIIVVSTDSLFGGMIFHTIYNAATVILAYITNQQTAQTGQEARSVFASIGGIPGLVQMALPAVFFCVLLVFTLKAIDADRIRKKGYVFGYPPAKPRPFAFSEYTVMGAGFSVVFMNYLTDLLTIMGWM